MSPDERIELDECFRYQRETRVYPSASAAKHAAVTNNREIAEQLVDAIPVDLRHAVHTVLSERLDKQPRNSDDALRDLENRYIALSAQLDQLRKDIEAAPFKALEAMHVS